MKIGLFADPHYSSQKESCGTRRPSLSYGKIREAMEQFRGQKADLVICLGDLMNAGEPDLLRDVSAMIHSFHIPFYCMMGNHDYGDFSREAFNELTQNSYPPFSVQYGNKTLIFPDANYLNDGQLYTSENLDWTNSFVPEDQVNQLKSVLADSTVTEAYIFLHQNIDPGVERHHIIRNAEEIRAILRDSGKVKAVYQGHYHPGHENIIDNIPHHTLPAMCEGEENRFRIVEI